MKISAHAFIAEGLALPENADIRGRAVINTLDDIRVYGPGRSSGKFTTVTRDADLGVRVSRSCFSGTVELFERVSELYAKSDPVMAEAAKTYLADMKAHFNV